MLQVIGLIPIIVLLIFTTKNLNKKFISQHKDEKGWNTLRESSSFKKFCSEKDLPIDKIDLETFSPFVDDYLAPKKRLIVIWGVICSIGFIVVTSGII